MKANPREAGQRIKQIRQRTGLTMEELGSRLDNSPRATVSNWERGTNLPNQKKLQSLASIGETSIDWIKWGTLEEYIHTYLISLGYRKFIFDFPETTHMIFQHLEKKYSQNYPLDKDYETLNIFIKSIFMQVYLPKFQTYTKNIVATELEIWSHKPHNISEDRFKKRFESNFNDLLKREGLKYGQNEEIILLGTSLLKEMDQAYQLQEKYSSIEDFFSQITESQFETEKFLLDLSKRYGFPYKKNSPTAKFLAKNNHKFKS